MKRKMKLEFFDRAGTKHSMAIEGEFSIEKIRRLLDYAEIIAGTDEISHSTQNVQETKMNRLLDVINTRLTDRSFDSRELWQVYRETWPDDLSLGAVSTYLSRLAGRGTVERRGSSSHWTYRVRSSPTLSQ